MAEAFNGRPDEFGAFFVEVQRLGGYVLGETPLSLKGIPGTLKVLFIRDARVVVLDRGIHGWQVFFPPTRDTSHVQALREFAERCDFIRRGLR